MVATQSLKAEQAEARDRLLSRLNPGDTVHTILRQVSRSGMSRHISAVLTTPNGIEDITWLVGRLLKDRRHDDGGLVVSGCGMDMGFDLVYRLGNALWPQGYNCIGERCPANDHRNARGERCAVCERLLKSTEQGLPPLFKRGHHPVCSQACASGQWIHRDGGYALTQRWL